MANPVYVLGATLLFVGMLVFLSAFIFPLLVGLNIRSSRDVLTAKFDRLPGFRTQVRWRLIGASFIYLIVFGFGIMMIGAGLTPSPAGGSDTAPTTESPTTTITTAASTPIEEASKTTAKSTSGTEPTTTVESTPKSTTATRAPAEVTATIRSTSDTDRDSGASAFEIVITANTTLKNADSGSDDFGEPYFVIEVGGETVLETDEVEKQSEGEFRYQLSEQQLRQFEDGELDVTVRLMDRDSLFDDEIGSWSGTVQYDAGQTETSTGTPTTTATPTTTTVSQIQTTTANIQPPAHTPDYEIDSTENLSYLGVVRIEVHVKTEKQAAQLSDAQLRRISQDIVASKASETKLNAVTVFFWKENAVVGAQQASATVDWAPNGEWSNAGDVKPGEYSTHEYSVRRFTTSPSTSTPASTTTK